VRTLEEVAEAVGTPFYAYDAGVLKERIARFRAALGHAPHLLCYAVKANDALALIAVAAREGLGADIVSGGELAKALRAGVPADRIVFSGVGKRPDEIRAALEGGIRSLNVESLGELDAVAEQAGSLGLVAPVSVRLNPDVSPETHAYISTGSGTTKFGLAPAETLTALRRAAADEVLEPVGISFHIGSQLFDHTLVLAAAAQAAELWCELAAEGLRLRDLDVGGGLGVAYEDGQDADVEALADTLAPLTEELGATLLLEPGRWLVARAGTLVTRVLYVKELADRRVAVCDAGMNDLIRPALYDAYHPIELLGDDGSRARGFVDVVGPVCETGDFFALGRALPLPEPGDLLAVRLAGAYGRVMASTYNARPLCAEVLREDAEWRVIREPGSLEDLVRCERL
jgi:diaminopimelate decarboxylase